MARLHLVDVCVVVCLGLILLSFDGTVTSSSPSCAEDCCEGCVINTYSIKSLAKRTCKYVTQQVTRYTSCGFLWLSRCARRGTTSVNQCTYPKYYYIEGNASCKPNCTCTDP